MQKKIIFTYLLITGNLVLQLTLQLGCLPLEAFELIVATHFHTRNVAAFVDQGGAFGTAASSTGSQTSIYSSLDPLKQKEQENY